MDIWAEDNDQSMIQLKTWNTAAAIDNSEIDLRLKPVGFYAQLTALDGRPISGAQVIAHVYNNNQLLTDVQLTDWGVADVTTGDGIYSAYFVPNLTSNSGNVGLVYSVRYEVTGNDSLAVVDSQPYERPPTTGSFIKMSQPIVAAVEFSRFSYGPSFRLTSSSLNGGDNIPPKRITDLTIKSYDSFSAVFTWRAPLDNYGTGDVITQFKMTQTVGSDSPATQIMNPQSTGNETVSFTIENVPSIVPDSYVTYRVVGVDSSNNEASPSNVV